jgi:hypothetical protein
LDGSKLKHPIPADICLEIILQGFLHFPLFFYSFLDIPSFFHTYRRSIEPHIIMESLAESWNLMKRLTTVTTTLPFLNVITLHLAMGMDDLQHITEIPKLPNLTRLSVTLEPRPPPNWEEIDHSGLLNIVSLILGFGSPKLTALELEVSPLYSRLVRSVLKGY